MKCDWCNKEIEKTRSKRNNTRFCSRECYLKFHETERYQAYLKDNYGKSVEASEKYDTIKKAKSQ
mgnify:CR=1 FL=1